MEDILCNNIKVKRFINTPVPSVTYLLEDEGSGHCIIIDPGSKEEIELRDYIQAHRLTLDYILLTHEHFDHCWGVNYLKDCFPLAKVVATRKCAEWVLKPWNYFNQMYYNSDEYYQIPKIDILVEDIDGIMEWNRIIVHIIMTPGHTDKGVCIEIGGCLFSGDTILYKTKPFLKKKYGASKEELKASIYDIYQHYPEDTIIYPGHGEPFQLGETKEYYNNYFNN